MTAQQKNYYTKQQKIFQKNKQFFSPKILNIYVDEKNICEKNTWKLRNYPKPYKQGEKDIMLSFIA